MKPRHKGIVCIIASAFCFALMNMFVRLAGDVPSIQKSFFRNIVAFIFAAIILMKDYKPGQNFTGISKKSWPYLLMRSIFGTLGILCNFYAVDHLNLSDASMLNKMSPFFAIIFSLFILKERLNLIQIISVIGAFIGSLFIIKPSVTNLDLIPALIGLTGGMGAGIAYAMVRKMGTQGVRGAFIVFFFSGFSCLVTLPYLLFQYHPMAFWQIGYLLLAGLAATGGQFGITAAYCYAPAREISVYDYSQIIFAAVLGFFVFGQVPDGWSFLGYIIIIGMAVLMFVYHNLYFDRAEPEKHD